MSCRWPSGGARSRRSAGLPHCTAQPRQSKHRTGTSATGSTGDGGSSERIASSYGLAAAVAEQARAATVSDESQVHTARDQPGGPTGDAQWLQTLVGCGIPGLPAGDWEGGRLGGDLESGVRELHVIDTWGAAGRGQGRLACTAGRRARPSAIEGSSGRVLLLLEVLGGPAPWRAPRGGSRRRCGRSPHLGARLTSGQPSPRVTPHLVARTPAACRRTHRSHRRTRRRHLPP